MDPAIKSPEVGIFIGLANMNLQLKHHIGLAIDEAIKKKHCISQITIKHPEISIQDAYDIQRYGIELRQGRGEKVIGFKMGLTSKVKQDQMQVKDPIFGILTDSMLVQDGSTLELSKFIHPKIEPEIGFIVAKSIKYPVTVEQVLANCSGVCAAIDVIDSRYEGFHFSLIDIIADNASAAGCIFGLERKDPKGMDLSNLAMNFYQDGQLVSSGLSKACLDNPVNSIILLAKMLANDGLEIPAGSLVLSGACMPAIELKKNSQYELQVDKIGKASIHII